MIIESNNNNTDINKKTNTNSYNKLILVAINFSHIKKENFMMEKSQK